MWFILHRELEFEKEKRVILILSETRALMTGHISIAENDTNKSNQWGSK